MGGYVENFFKDHDMAFILFMIACIFVLFFAVYMFFSTFKEIIRNDTEKAVIIECLKNDKCKTKLEEYFKRECK